MDTASAVAQIPIETQTIRKLWLRIIPFVFVLFVIAFIDRINIGFAALTMNRELQITSEQFGLISGIFFIGYFLFEIPSNLALHQIGARVWLARILISWGVVAVLTGFIESVRQLYFMRFLLGLAEAGYFPGIVLYLTYWFRRREQAQAVALFMTGLPVANIVGAPISGLILDHVHWLGISNWRWLLILEGIPAIVFGALTYWVLPSHPSEARFLTAPEKDWLTAELKREEQQKLDLGPHSVVQALTSGRVWSLILIYFGICVGSYALNFWAPQVMKAVAVAYSNTAVGLCLMAAHLAGLTAMILVSRSSDRTLERRWHTAVPLMTGGVALLVLGAARSPLSCVVLLSLLTIGVFSSFGPFWAVPNQFLAGFSAAAGIALINSVSNLGGLIGPYVVGAISTRTGSIYLGLAVSGLTMIVSAVIALFLLKRRTDPAPDCA
jgi:sugar phosphate permease